MTTQNAFLSAIDTAGNVQLINIGTNDNSVPIYYELETQEIEMGDRSHLKKTQDKLVILSKNAVDSSVQIRQDEKDYEILQIKLDNTVVKSKSNDFKFNFFTLKWLGNSINLSPIFEGFRVENIMDYGVTK